MACRHKRGAIPIHGSIERSSMSLVWIIILFSDEILPANEWTDSIWITMNIQYTFKRRVKKFVSGRNQVRKCYKICTTFMNFVWMIWSPLHPQFWWIITASSVLFFFFSSCSISYPPKITHICLIFPHLLLTLRPAVTLLSVVRQG